MRSINIAPTNALRRAFIAGMLQSQQSIKSAEHERSYIMRRDPRYRHAWIERG